MRRSFRRFLVLVMATATLLAEPLQVGGVIERTEAGDLVWRSAEGTINAVLQDPLGLAAGLPARTILQVEKTGTINSSGLAIWKLDGRVPEFWSQPRSFNHFMKGPGAFSGFGRDLRPKDFAGIPFEGLRAYARDNGAEIKKASVTLLPEPLHLGSIAISGGVLSFSYSPVAGTTYRLLFSADLSQPFRSIQEARAESSSPVTLELPIGRAAGFYLLEAVQP